MNKTMKAAILEGLNKISVKDIPIPLVSDDDVLIKVDSCSICGSDLRIIATENKRLNPGSIMGHEIAGTIVNSGKNYRDKFKVGAKVALSADIPCGSCYWCRLGPSNNCENNIAFGHEYAGGFAEYLILNKRILDHGPVVVLNESDITQDVFCLSEPLACCINGLEKIDVKKDSTVLIFGAGPIGCIFTMLCKNSGAKVALCDLDEERISASKISNADEYLAFSEHSISATVERMTEGRGFDVIIIACPSKDAQEMSLSHIKNKGTVLFFGGLPQNAGSINFDSNKVHYKEIIVIGAHGSTPAQHRRAVDMISSGKIILDKLVSKKFSLSEFNIALEEAKKKSNLKIIINP